MQSGTSRPNRATAPTPAPARFDPAIASDTTAFRVDRVLFQGPTGDFSGDDLRARCGTAQLLPPQAQQVREKPANHVLPAPVRPERLISMNPLPGGNDIVPILIGSALRMRRGYREDEVLARTLDLMGERWTLLILRDLLLGPRRFNDLSRGLPRLSRNLLSDRLQHLEDEGLVMRRELPPPARAWVYEVSEEGWSLACAVAPLAVWGASRLDPDQARKNFRASTFALGMVAFASPEAATGVFDSCQFVVDNETFHLEIADGRIRPFEGQALHPDVVVSTDAGTCIEIMAGKLAPVDAVEAGRMRADGDADAAMRLLAIFPGPSLSGSPSALTRSGSKA